MVREAVENGREDPHPCSPPSHRGGLQLAGSPWGLRQQPLSFPTTSPPFCLPTAHASDWEVLTQATKRRLGSHSAL